jgi:hypothetical protein
VHQATKTAQANGVDRILAKAVVAGLIRHPAEIARHMEVLGSLKLADGALLQARVAAEISELHPGPLQKSVVRCQRPVPKVRPRAPRRDRIVITLC